MRPKGSAAELEARRRLAASLLANGSTCAEIAKLMGVDSSSVKRWKAAWKKGGVEALAAIPHPGRTPRLALSQKRRLVKLLLRGPLKAGYRTDLWTCARVADLIHKQFDVGYHVDHVGRLLHALGWTCQQSEQRARERDEAKIAAWRAHDWPRLKKERAAKSYHCLRG
jgi:transposase